MLNKQSHKLEILAPCGDMESVIAAVQNGANAVYLGQKDFSARQNAKNFDKDELLKAVIYCHSRDVKVYQTLNTLVFDSQINSAIDCIKTACSCAVDAFIVQDLGILSLLRQLCPAARIHASTQMAVHTVKGAQLLADLGIARVVLARELALSQIEEISKQVDIETEVFVQGALCMSVSGQCYISSMIGTRSGNRGNCAGTCRLPFSADERELLPSNDLSLKDLCLAEHIDELKAAGVTSVKIEGRMKRPEYVASASRVYSNANNGEEFDTEILQAVFSRSGFTDGYLTGKTGDDMFGIRQKDDVVSATNALLKSIENDYKKESGIISLDMAFTLKRDEAPILHISDNKGDEETVVSDTLPQEAINKPATAESVSISLQKLGGTYFKAGKLTCDIEDGLSFPMSKLNELRRNAVEQLITKREKITPIPYVADYSFKTPAPKQNNEPYKLRARFEKFSQIPFERMKELEYIILPVDEVIDNTDRLSFFAEKVIIEPYRAMYLNEQEIIKKLTALKEKGFNKLSATNIAHIKMGNELKMQIFGSCYLNAANSLSAEQLKAIGVNDLTLSFELNLDTAKKITADIPLGIMIYGYLPLMLLKNCPIKNHFTCKECNNSKSLTDRMGIKFKIICNRQKYSELLNSNPLYMADRLKEVAPLSFGVLYFTTENLALCDRLITEHQTATPAYSAFTRGLYYRNV